MAGSASWSAAKPRRAATRTSTAGERASFTTCGPSARACARATPSSVSATSRSASGPAWRSVDVARPAAAGSSTWAAIHSMSSGWRSRASASGKTAYRSANFLWRPSGPNSARYIALSAGAVPMPPIARAASARTR
jgi:hypothetical protein